MIPAQIGIARPKTRIAGIAMMDETYAYVAKTAPSARRSRSTRPSSVGRKRLKRL